MKQSTRRERLAKNFFASVFDKGLLIARQLFLVPLFIHAWGVEVYGKYLVLSAIPTVLAMSNLGMGTAAGAQVALEIAGGKVKEASRTFISGLIMMLSIGIFLSALALIVPRIWPGITVEFASLGYPEVMLAFLILSLASDQPNEVLLGVFNGSGRAASGLQVMNFTQFTRLSIMATLLTMRLSPTTVIVTDCSINIVATFILFWRSVLCCPQLLSRDTRFDWEVARRLFGNGLGFQSSALWQAILFQGSLWFANSTLGAAGAATWSTLRALGRSLNQLFAMVNQTVFPELQMAIAKEDYVTARRIHGNAVLISGVMGVLSSLPFIVAGPTIYHVWTKGKLAVPYIVWPLLGLTGLLSGLWWTSGIIYRALNRPWLINSAGVISAVFSVSIMYALSASLKIVGFAIGALVFEAIMAARILATSLRLLDDDFRSMLVRASRELLMRKAAQ